MACIVYDKFIYLWLVLLLTRNINCTQIICSYFQKFASKHLKWDECYSLEKFLPLVTRWLLLQQKDTSKCPIYPESIVKSRVLKGVASYEVKWADREGLFETLITEENTELCLTIEPKEMFEIAFPKLVLKFHEEELAKKDAKRKGLLLITCYCFVYKKLMLPDKYFQKSNAFYNNAYAVFFL